VAGVLLLAITVVLAAGVVTAVIAAAPPEPAPMASLSLSAVDDRITITHRGGDALDASELTVRVRVDDEPLARQPPVPSFRLPGFHRDRPARSTPRAPTGGASANRRRFGSPERTSRR